MSKTKTKFVCTNCGYETDFESSQVIVLKECPRCGAPMKCD